MEDVIGAPSELLLEQILLAVTSITEEGDVFDHIQKTFGVSDHEFMEARNSISENYNAPRVCLILESVTFRNMISLTGVADGVTCVIRVGDNEPLTKELSFSTPEWNMSHEFLVGPLGSTNITVESWHELEKEEKEPLARSWLRSLDLFSKKVRATLRNENVGNNASSTSNEDDTFLLKVPENEKLTIVDNSDGPVSEEKDNSKKHESPQSCESNWVLNAFATLRRSGSVGKRLSMSGNKTIGHSSGARRQLDMSSAIPTGRETLREGWRAKSERSFFMKNDLQPKIKVGSQLSTPGSISGSQTNLQSTDIKPKIEVNVNRQPISNDSNISKTDVAECPIVETRLSPISVVNPMYGFKGPLNNKSADDLLSLAKPKETLSRTRQGNSLRYGSQKLSPKNEFQLWKRMSWTLRDKSAQPTTLESLEATSNVNINLPTFTIGEYDTSNDGSLVNVREEETERMKTKVKIGLSSTTLKDAFVKMSCPKWTADEEAVLVLSSPKKDNLATRPSTLRLTFQLQCQSTPTPIPATKVFGLCLDKFLISEEGRECKDSNDLGLCLPLSPNSILVLKSLAFIYDISDAQLSMACWLALVSKSYPSAESENVTSSTRSLSSSYVQVDKVSEMGLDLESGNDTISIENKHTKLKRVFSGLKNIHPKFLFHWLTRVEAAATCSFYTEEEEREIALSIQTFIDSMCLQFKRIHAAFPVNQASHLAFSLRCVHLLTSSPSLQNIVGKTNLEAGGDSWPKTNIINAVKIHVKNWTDALINEIQNGVRENQSFSMIPHNDSNSVLESASGLFLLQAITNGEKAALAINDFVVLGEKVYEANFESELNESYLEAVWPTISSTLVTLLSPIQSILQSSVPKEILHTGSDCLQDVHISLWILLLQLSKLQRFQNSREKKLSQISLPETFSDTFFLLSRLWLEICLLRAREMIKLECQMEDLSLSENEERLSPSARELADFFSVMQEKLSRFCFPSDKIFKENLASFLEDKLRSVMELYECHICNLVLEKNDQTNTLTQQMCIAANNIEHVIDSAVSIIFSLSPRREKEAEHSPPFREYMKDACFFLFTKCVPRISSWITNALSMRDENAAPEHLLEWMKSAMEPVLGHSSVFTLLVRHFWDFVSRKVAEKLKEESTPKEYRICGNFVEKLYFFYKITLKIDLHTQSQIEFQDFMETIQLKGSSTTEVIQMYYNERYKEQESLPAGKQPLVVNAYFCEDSCLKVEILLSPSITVTTDKRRSLVLPNEVSVQRDRTLRGRFPSISSFKDARFVTRLKRRASSVVQRFTRSATVSFYVKVQPVPSNWFKRVKERKTKSTQMNPPVFEDQLSLNIKCLDEGVQNGGFLLLRLKYSSLTSSGVESEALLPLKKVPLLSFEERRRNKHTFLKLSAPTRLEDYKSLMELATRKQDREANSFLGQISQAFWTMDTYYSY